MSRVVGTNSNRFGTYASRRVEELAMQRYPGEAWRGESREWGHTISLAVELYANGQQHRNVIQFGHTPLFGKLSPVDKKIAELGSMEAVLEWFARGASDMLMGWVKTIRERHAGTPDAQQQERKDRADPGQHNQRRHLP